MNDTLMLVVTFPLSFALFGITFFIIGIVIHNNNKKKEINCTSMTYGKVIDIVRHRNSDDSSSTWHTVFEYNIGELKFRKESPYGSSQQKYAIGQDLEIYYNPENYNEYYIAGDTLPRTIAIIFAIVGIGATTIAIICAILTLQLKL